MAKAAKCKSKTTVSKAKSPKAAAKKKYKRPSPPTKLGQYRRTGKRLFIARTGKHGKPVWKPIKVKEAAKKRFNAAYKNKPAGRKADKAVRNAPVATSASGFMTYKPTKGDFKGVDAPRKARKDKGVKRKKPAAAAKKKTAKKKKATESRM